MKTQVVLALVVCSVFLMCSTFAMVSPTDSLVRNGERAAATTLEYAVMNEDEEEQVLMATETLRYNPDVQPVRVPRDGVVTSRQGYCVFDCSFFFVNRKSKPACTKCLRSVKYTRKSCYTHPLSFGNGDITSRDVENVLNLCKTVCESCVTVPPTPNHLGLFKVVTMKGQGEGVQNKPPAATQ